MKVQLMIDIDVEDKALTARSPLMRVLKALCKDGDAQVKWYNENRERILAVEREKRALYAKEQYAKRKAKKDEEALATNQVIMPEMPKDNVLRFDNL